MKILINLLKSLILLIVLVTNYSCASKKDVLLFQDIEIINQFDYTIKELVLKNGDLLDIKVFPLNSEITAPFNNLIQDRDTELPVGYLVSANGTIDFPLIGTIQLNGKTKSEAVAILTEKLKDYIKDPVIQLNVKNFSISVLGEVNNPGNFVINDENATVLEALGLAGDMTIFGNRKSVQVIRESDGKRTYGELDFTSIDVVNSSFFNLEQGDVIVVAPNGAQIQSSAVNRNASILISLVGLAISVITVVSR